MNTSSIGFPNMFDVSRNKLAIYSDRASIVNRVRLLILTEPTELYNNPTYGVGLKRYMFQYNNANIIAQIKDRIIDQLTLWEPCVDAQKTEVVSGLLYTGNSSSATDNPNHLKLTVTLHSIYGDTISTDFESSQEGR